MPSGSRVLAPHARSQSQLAGASLCRARPCAPQYQGSRLQSILHQGHGSPPASRGYRPPLSPFVCSVPICDARRRARLYCGGSARMLALRPRAVERLQEVDGHGDWAGASHRTPPGSDVAQVGEDGCPGVRAASVRLMVPHYIPRGNATTILARRCLVGSYMLQTQLNDLREAHHGGPRHLQRQVDPW